MRPLYAIPLAALVGWAICKETQDEMKTEVIGNATLHLGDCREIMPQINGFDAIVTDPPYGIGVEVRTRSTKGNDVYAGGSYHTNFEKIAGDDAEFDPRPLLRWPSILWGANNYAARLPASNGWLCWYKAGGISGFKMSECELAWTNVLNSSRFIDHMWHGFKRASEVGEKVLHPTQKPVAVMGWCLGFVGGAVLDPFMGSGTTGVAATRAGRKFIGIEIDPAHFDTACHRIDEAWRQGDLFIESKEDAVAAAMPELLL